MSIIVLKKFAAVFNYQKQGYTCEAVLKIINMEITVYVGIFITKMGKKF